MKLNEDNRMIFSPKSVYHSLGKAELCVNCVEVNIMRLNVSEKLLVCEKCSNSGRKNRGTVTNRIGLKEIKHIEKNIFRKLIGKRPWFSIKNFIYKCVKSNKQKNNTMLDNKKKVGFEQDFNEYNGEHLDFYDNEHLFFESSNRRRKTYDPSTGFNDYYQEYRYKRNISVDENCFVRNSKVNGDCDLSNFEDKSHFENCKLYNSSYYTHKDDDIMAKNENDNKHNIISKNPFDYC